MIANAPIFVISKFLDIWRPNRNEWVIIECIIEGERGNIILFIHLAIVVNHPGVSMNRSLSNPIIQEIKERRR